jgi:putative endonuclease
MRSHQLGQDGELFALDFLRAGGYEIIQCNYRAKTGEIDVVARDGETLCFIEVKTRQEVGWDAFESVDRRKQAKIRRVALTYLQEFCKTEDVLARFDVLAVRSNPDTGLSGELLKDAFGI